MSEKYGFVYIWFDRRRKMYYVGCHWGYENDGYICSSNRMRDAYKRRPQDFKRRILKTNLEKEVLLIEEYKWLKLMQKEELGKKYYNYRNLLSPDIGIGRSRREDIIKKISESKKGKENTRTFGFRGKKHSEESNEKNRQSHLGKKHTKESLEKLKQANIGKVKDQKNNTSGFQRSLL